MEVASKRGQFAKQMPLKHYVFAFIFSIIVSVFSISIVSTNPKTLVRVLVRIIHGTAGTLYWGMYLEKLLWIIQKKGQKHM